MAATKPEKPSKPYPTFPLTPHDTRRWCKKINGKLYYFGSWDDPEGAEAEYRKYAPSLQAGIDPRKHQTTGATTLNDVCQKYLAWLEGRMNEGDITPRTWRDRRDCCKRLCDILGKPTPIAALTPQQWEKVRGKLAETLGPVALRVELQRIRSIFNWARDDAVISVPIVYGRAFRGPSKKVMNRHKADAPKRELSADEIKSILAAARQPLHAMTLLGINAALGNNDVALLTEGHFRGRWLEFPRPKNEQERRCWLWPETIASLDAWREVRPASESPYLFVTRFGGAWRWEQEDGTYNDEVNKQFGKLLRSLGINRRGVNFYALRHVFRTQAGNACDDERAIDLVMGHAIEQDDMGGHYTTSIDDKRLQAVANGVRKWLFGK